MSEQELPPKFNIVAQRAWPVHVTIACAVCNSAIVPVPVQRLGIIRSSNDPTQAQTLFRYRCTNPNCDNQTVAELQEQFPRVEIKTEEWAMQAGLINDFIKEVIGHVEKQRNAAAQQQSSGESGSAVGAIQSVGQLQGADGGAYPTEP